MFKGFGQQQSTIDSKFKEMVDVNLHGYEWLKAQVSNDKDASRQLAQFVMRCLATIKKQDSPAKDKMSGSKLAEFQMYWARMLTYAYYTDMSIVLAENEPSGIQGMSVASTIDVLCQTTDEHLQMLSDCFTGN